MDRADAGGGGRDRDRGLDAPLVAIAVTGAIAALVALLEFGARAALGVAIGAAIGVANLWVFGRVVRAFLAADGKAAPWTAVALLKLLGLFGGFWLLLHHHVVDVIPLVVGYGALPVGITVGGIFSAKRADREGS